MKQALTSAPILGFADFNEEFILETDGSQRGLGAVLSQYQKGQLKVIAYASRALKGAERNHTRYSSMKLELLALKWAVVEKFRDYLIGAKFVIFTDNNPLKYIMSTAKLKAVEQKWVGDLSRFNFEVKYRPGKSNGNADALSRRPVQAPEDFEEMDENEVSAVMGLTRIPEENGKSHMSIHTAEVHSVEQQLPREIPAVFPAYSRTEIGQFQEEDPITKGERSQASGKCVQKPRRSSPFCVSGEDLNHRMECFTEG